MKMTTPSIRRVLSICPLRIVLLALAFPLLLSAQAPYIPHVRVTGTIRFCGSPQMGELLKRYEVGFHQLQPSVRFDEDLKSTLTAVDGVASGRADIGLLGREIWPVEVASFKSIKRHAPLVVDVATGSFDVPKATFALMVFAPRSNPLKSLSTNQLERIFSNTTKRPIRTWGDAGLTGTWATRPVHIYGFSVGNDKSQVFAQLIFKTSDHWNAALHEAVNSPDGVDAGESITRLVGSDPDSIGISNVHYATSDVRAIPLSTMSHRTPILPTRETVASRRYPLARTVFMVVNKDPAQPLQPAAREFLLYVLSQEGRLAVLEEGNYLPLPEDIASRQRGLLR